MPVPLSIKASLFSGILLLARDVTKAVTLPPVNGKADYQLGGSYAPAADVRVVVRDSTENPVTNPDVYNICYINGFQTQPDDDSVAFWNSPENVGLLLHRPNGEIFEDPDWPGEYLLDTRTAAQRTAIANILNGWIDSCAAKGFDAIEPDNLDTFTRSDSILKVADNLALAKLIADHAHSLGLAIAQKNTAEIEGEGKAVAGFDFAVVEGCQEWSTSTYDECAIYSNVYGNNMIEIEYTDAGIANWNKACTARGSKISVLYRDRDLVTPSSRDYVYQEC